MRALAITKKVTVTENGQEVYETTSQCNFDQGEVFSWTVINDEDNIPDYIVLITKYGVSMELEYDEDVLSKLAAEFRSRGVL